MNKILLIVIIGLLSACTEPKDIVLNDAADIEKNASALQKLPEEDRKLLTAYILRAELSKLGNGNNNYGITVQQAIEKQKQFLLDEEKRKQEEEKRAAQIAQQYSLTFAGFTKTEILGIGEGLNLQMALKNNTDKAISAIHADIALRVEGLDKGTLLLVEEKFNSPIEPNQVGNLKFLTSIDKSLPMIKIAQGNATVQLRLEKATILHTDGSVIEIK